MPLILIASAIVGCRSATPAAVAPSIEAWSTFGLSCGERRADNVPSGLFQWTCRSDHRGIPLGTLSRSEEHTSELQSRENLVCRLLLEKKKKISIYVRR